MIAIELTKGRLAFLAFLAVVFLSTTGGTAFADCSGLSISPGSVGANPAGGQYSLTLYAAGDCNWSSYPSFSWFNVSPSSGTGSTSITLTVLENVGSSRANSVLFDGPGTFGDWLDVSQLSGNPTSFTATPSQITIPDTIVFDVNTVGIIEVQLEYVYNSTTYQTGGFWTDQNGSWSVNYTSEHIPVAGTYNFTKVRNAHGGAWNDINVSVTINAP